MSLEEKIQILRISYKQAIAKGDTVRAGEIKQHAFFIKDLIERRDGWKKDPLESIVKNIFADTLPIDTTVTKE